MEIIFRALQTMSGTDIVNSITALNFALTNQSAALPTISGLIAQVQASLQTLNGHGAEIASATQTCSVSLTTLVALLRDTYVLLEKMNDHLIEIKAAVDSLKDTINATLEQIKVSVDEVKSSVDAVKSSVDDAKTAIVQSVTTVDADVKAVDADVKAVNRSITEQTTMETKAFALLIGTVQSTGDANVEAVDRGACKVATAVNGVHAAVERLINISNEQYIISNKTMTKMGSDIHSFCNATKMTLVLLVCVALLLLFVAIAFLTQKR